MSFASLEFIFFFLIIFTALYYAVPKRAKAVLLAVFSLVFYGWMEPLHVLVLLGVSLQGWINALLFEKHGRKKLFFVITVITDIGLLILFRYTDFIISLLNMPGIFRLRPLGLKVPLGISFYVFSSISYASDVASGKIRAERNFVNYLVFISMFTKLINGPVTRYGDISDEIRDVTVSKENLFSGFERFLYGLIKKVLIADSLASAFAAAKASANLSASTAWLGIICYTLEIYVDFSSYSDMAIGLSRMFGFTLKENFDYPYTAVSFTDFWRRWHISLSSFFRDYVYIPLGGNRKGKGRTVFNLLCVWLLTGIWHGAGINFILWGLWWGVLLIIEKFVFPGLSEKLPVPVKRVITLLAVIIGWELFAFTDTKMMLSYLGIMFSFTGASDGNFLYLLKNYAVEIAAAVALCSPAIGKWIYKDHNAFVSVLISLVTLALLVFVTARLVTDSYSTFLYFDF